MGFKNPIHLTRAQEPQTCGLTLYKYGNAPSALLTLSLLLVCFFNLLNWIKDATGESKTLDFIRVVSLIEVLFYCESFLIYLFVFKRVEDLKRRWHGRTSKTSTNLGDWITGFTSSRTRSRLQRYCLFAYIVNGFCFVFDSCGLMVLFYWSEFTNYPENNEFYALLGHQIQLVTQSLILWVGYRYKEVKDMME